MNVSVFISFIVLSLFAMTLEGASQNPAVRAPVRTHELENLQAEIQIIFEQIETQDKLIGSLRQEVENALTSSRSQSNLLSAKFAELDLTAKTLAKDLLALKEPINGALKELEKLSKQMETQGKNIQQLEMALTALVEAATPEKGEALARHPLGYKVKLGDSLEKIARENKTTPKAIKELNHLTKDTIFVGQNLILP